MADAFLKKKALEEWFQEVAPPVYQADFDNSGWIVQWKDSFSKALLCLDCTEEVVEEAIQQGCDLIIAHHPLLFRGIKRLTQGHYVERSLLKAIHGGVSIYACHTNLDHVFRFGVNEALAHSLGLVDCQILRPMPSVWHKLVVFVPQTHINQVEEAMFLAGAGRLGNYEACCFRGEGQGFFRPLEGANPHLGAVGKRHMEPEIRTEVLVEQHLKEKVLEAAKQAHPYEEMAYDLYALENLHPGRGSGLVGSLPDALPVPDFLNLVKQKLGLKSLKYSDPLKSTVHRVALCGGSGFFLLEDAIQKADAFLTSDVSYHQYFEAKGRILLLDAGHFETEQFTPIAIHRLLTEKFPNFAALITQVHTNPVNYL